MNRLRPSPNRKDTTTELQPFLSSSSLAVVLPLPPNVFPRLSKSLRFKICRFFGLYSRLCAISWLLANKTLSKKLKKKDFAFEHYKSLLCTRYDDDMLFVDPLSRRSIIFTGIYSTFLSFTLPFSLTHPQLV